MSGAAGRDDVVPAAPRLPGLLVGLGVLVLALHLVAPTLAPPALWGTRTWVGIPLGARLLLVVVAVGALLTPRPFDAPLRRATLSRGARVAGLLAGGVLLAALGSRTLWGNAEIAANAATRGDVSLKHALASTLAAGLAGVLSWFTESPRVGGHALSALSVASGVAYLAGAAALGRAAFPGDRVKARLVLGVLATAGLVQQFFGVVETYAPATAAQLWTLVLLVRTASDDERVALRSPIPLLAAAAVTTALFVATVFVWPAVLLVAFRRRAAFARRSRALGGALAVAVPLLVAAWAVHAWGRGDWEAMAGRFGGHDANPWVPLDKPPGAIKVHFTLVSIGHLLARLDAALLFVPAWPLLAMAAVEARGPADPGDDALGPLGRNALLLAGAGALSFFVLVHPDMGPTRDWMQTATGALAPYAAVTILALRSLTTRWAVALGVPCLVLSAAHTLPWVIVNAGLS